MLTFLPLGNDFLNHLSHVIFPLGVGVWEAINDKHNRGGTTTDIEFNIFFGRKYYCYPLYSVTLYATLVLKERKPTKP
jgi:hypothetical protein